VPKGGETRLRIVKTYTDAASYYLKDGQLVFIRPLGIKRNVVVLPKGWELIQCDSPGIVSTDADGRVRVSFVNDRDDQLPVKLVARRLP
jgi:dUTPase